MKTGYTSEAGFCLTATARRNNMRLIAIVFGAEDSRIRNAEISKMLDYGFNVYEPEKLLSSSNVVGRIEVIKGKRKYINLVPIEDLNILYKKGETKKDFIYKIEINENKAPLRKGDNIGLIKALDNGKVIISVGVTVQENVDKANILQLYLRYLLDLVKGDINLRIR